MLIRAGHAALEHGEHAFDGVRVRIAAHVLASRVIDSAVPREAARDPLVGVQAVGVL